MGVFGATSVSAEVSEGATLEVSDNLPGAEDVTMTVTFQVDTVPTDGVESITVTLPSEFEQATDADASATQDGDTIRGVNLSGDVATIAFNMVTDDDEDGVDYLDAPAAGVDIVLKITGLTNPTAAEVAAVDGDGDPTLGPVIILQGVAGDDNVAREVAHGISASGGTLALSSATAGAAVQVVVNAWAVASKNSANDITVNLANFGVPSSITERSIIIEDVDEDTGQGTEEGEDPQYVGEPGSIVVSGTKVTLALFARFPGADGAAGTSLNRYRITFKQSAGITNPAVAGTATVSVGDGDLQGHTLTSTINSVVSLKPASGSRGTATTVSVVGIGKGGATAYLVQGDCADQHADCPPGDAEDISLGNGTESGGKVSIEIETSSSDFVEGVDQVDKAGKKKTDTDYVATDSLRGRNQITIVDGTGRTADKTAYFTITPTIEVDEEAAQQGDELTITFDDWTYGLVTAVTIGDEDVSDFSDGGSGSDFEIDIVVPPSARLGVQELKVTGTSDDLEGSLTNLKKDVAKGTVTIGALDITVDPPTFVLGQQFTVKVSGLSADPPDDNPLTEDDDESDVPPIQYVKVGDVGLNNTTGNVPVNMIDIDTNGNFNNTFVITSSYKDSTTADEASTRLTPGSYRVEVKDWTGRIAVGRITIPEPTITVTPSVSRRGTTVTVAGENFPAVRVVQVYYGDVRDENLQGAVLADSAGRINISFTVPSNAEIGDEQDVTAQSAAKPINKFRAKASHELPPQEIIVAPMQVASGGRLTIEGHNMPLFTIVKLSIAGITVAGTGAETDNLGSFVKQEVLVPQLKAGTHTVEASVSTQGADDEKVRTTIEIVDAFTTGTPTEVFETLGDRLVRVWFLERSTQVWSFYDPDPEIADFNTLSEVTSGQIVTIILTEGETLEFTSTPSTLYAGTNPVSLK